MFGDVLKALRISRRFTQSDLADRLGLAKSTVSMYENNQRIPPFEMMEKIADLFNVDMNYLYEKESVSGRLIDPLLSAGFLPPPSTVKVPRLGRISCGVPIDSEENFDGYDDVPDMIHCDFTLVCEGDSMIGARIHDGDLVYIRQQPAVENGQIAAVLVDGDGKLLKRVYRDGDRLTLAAENPAYPPLIFVREEINRVMIIGKAVGFTSVIK